MEKEKVEIVETEKGKSLGKTAKIIAICAFCTVMAALLCATISDVAIFADQILHFVGGMIISAMLFVFMLVCFAVSFILVFGFYIVESHGFWPWKVAFGAFKEIIGDITFNESQLLTFSSIRWTLLSICILCLISAIVSLAIRKSAISEGFKDKNKHIKKFNVNTIVFSSLGIVFALVIFLILK